MTRSALAGAAHPSAEGNVPQVQPLQCLSSAAMLDGREAQTRGLMAGERSK
jgi:hypothetical protein